MSGKDKSSSVGGSTSSVGSANSGTSSGTSSGSARDLPRWMLEGNSGERNDPKAKEESGAKSSSAKRSQYVMSPAELEMAAREALGKADSNRHK